LRGIISAGIGGGLFVAGLGLALTGIGAIVGFPLMLLGMAIVEGSDTRRRGDEP
jgi:hypothetical protein